MIAARYFCCAAASTRYAAKRESRNMSDINGSKPTNFPLDESKLDFKIPRTDAPRENVLKLGSMITNRIGLKATADDPEYWGLAGVMTDEMVDVALKMGVRKPKTTEQLMKLTKMEREPLEKLLTEMAWTGIIEYNWENLDGKNPKHEKRWVLPLFVPGSAEFLNMRKSQIDEHPEVAAFFERMTMLPLEKITPMVPPGGAGIGMHVIPVEKAIETESESVDLEHISYWLSKYEGKYAKSMCSCRASRAKLGEGCGDDAESWCIGVGDMADYIVETQRGEYITKDEALEIFKKAEDNGFVHQITNIDGEQKIFGICNCNVNVCNALRTSQLFNTPNLSRSAYVASVESESCVACGRCVENCPAGAVKLGQKLCTKDGYIEYPRQELPDDVKWGPEKWSIDYRDRNRINCYDTGTSPCKTACPAHIAVQGYLKLAAQGKYREALQLIKRENPFPAVCGRICNRRCEDACTRGTVDQAVAIDEVKRFIAQQDLNAETRFVPEKVIPKVDGEFSEKIAVIGGTMAIAGTPNLGLTGMNTLTLGMIASFLTLSRGFTNPISQISNQFNSIVTALAGASRIFAFMDAEPETDDGYVTLVNAKEENGTLAETDHHTGLWAWKHPHGDGTVTYTKLAGRVVFDHVDFGYTPDKEVLHDITLYAEPGQKVAFVGATGAGKTTITNLINRFYDIADGKIRYDGININKICKTDLRRSLGIVLQDVNLFTGTVMENIRYGNPAATDDECIAAAKLANADHFIRMLPDGYNTVLKGDGSGLSQGQRQLLSIARAAVSDPPVMILDEATSSIDTRTEALVQSGMDKLMEGRTVFVIAHRLSTVKNADVIMVLDHGRIIERGNHAKLIAEKGVYYQLYTGAFELE